MSINRSIKGIFFLLAMVMIAHTAYTQNKNFTAGAQAKNTMKSDIITFQRQMMGLLEYTQERAKIPDMQKTYKKNVKVRAVVDTEDVSAKDEDDEETTAAKKLTGYIRDEVGDTYVNLYQVSYDRNKKKITAVIPTGDTLELDNPEKNIKNKKSHNKMSTAKKADYNGDAEEEDEPKQKPVKKKAEDKDDE